jgi:hypothetical protein
MAERRLVLGEGPERGDIFSLPLSWMTLATVVYGARGSGKTTLGRVVAEEMSKAGQRFCAIDLKGDFFGLKSTVDGSGEGIPVVIFGGDHADLPLEEGAGRFVAETIAGLDQSVIIDLEHLSKGKQLRFLAAFFERLYDVNREPILLLLDEAQRYAPQRPMNPEATICLGAVEDLVKLGRKHGIGVILFTQRGSGLNKEVSELCDLLVAFRTPGPLDQERIKGWLDANATREERDQVMGALAKMATGQAIFASGHPALDVFTSAQVRRPETFDSSATPEVGKRRVEPKRLAQPDLNVLRAKMADAIGRAKENDPKALRAEVARLRANLAETERQLQVSFDRPDIIREVEVERIVEVVPREMERLLIDTIRLVGDMGPALAKLGEYIGNINTLVLAAQEIAHGATPMARQLPPPKPAPAPPPPVAATVPDDQGLSNYAMSLLQTMAQRHPMTLSRAQLGLFAKKSTRSSAFDVALSQLRRGGYFVMDDQQGFVLTVGGWDAVGGQPAPPKPGEVLDHWRAVLPPGPRLFLDALVEARRPLSREEIAEATGRSLTSSAFDVNISTLKKMGLVDGDRSGYNLNGDLL